jgi:hypothetical protein
MKTCWGLISALLLSACASAFMNGGTTVAAPPASPTAKFVVKACTNMANQAPVPIGGSLNYYLEETPSGPVLYEFDDKGDNGSKFTNHWVQEDGSDVFFMSVSTSHAYQYVLTKDRSQGGVRFVYPKGTYETYSDNGTTKVKGAASLLCVMAAE